MAVGSFISVGRSLDDAVARVRLAELGHDAAYVTHIAGRDSLTVLAGYAAATSRIALGTGVVPI
jgi:alkanesulfonate monooxygenase SsuD/methylene tetrahydromethanopterin reductase-like flavin-dependent oxidoreductase (luciferase family)